MEDVSDDYVYDERDGLYEYRPRPQVQYYSPSEPQGIVEHVLGLLAATPEGGDDGAEPAG